MIFGMMGWSKKKSDPPGEMKEEEGVSWDVSNWVSDDRDEHLFI